MDNDLAERYANLERLAKEQWENAPYWAVWFTVNPETGMTMWHECDWYGFLEAEPVPPQPGLNPKLCVWNRYK